MVSRGSEVLVQLVIAAIATAPSGIAPPGVSRLIQGARAARVWSGASRSCGRRGPARLHVPYRGSAPAVADVAGGTVTMSFSSLGAALPLIKDGRLRAVAVTSKERMPQLPDVAPLGDAPGLAGYELLNWFAVFAPAWLPEPVMAKLTETIPAILSAPEITAKLDVHGIVPRKMYAAELRDFVKAESAKFGKIIETAKITLDN